MNDRHRTFLGVSGPEVLRLVVLAAWLGAFVWLLGGHLIPGARAAAPPYQVFIRAGLWPVLAMGLVLLALFLLAVFLRAGRSATGAAEPTWNRWARLGLLLLPLVYLAAAPSTGLGSYSFNKRFVSGGVPRSGQDGVRRVTRDPRRPPGQVTLIELLYELDTLEGQTIETIGQVAQGDRWPPGHFMLFRFVILCCAADASPVGALVRHPDAGSFPPNTWVRVSGTVRREMIDGVVQAVIEARDIVRGDPPDNPYLYPF